MVETTAAPSGMNWGMINLIVILFVSAGCSPSSPTEGTPTTTAPANLVPRTFRMGFSFDAPPLPTPNRYFERFEIWTRRADGAIAHSDVPWERLLAGEAPSAILRDGLLEQVGLFRSRGLAVVVTLEPLNGLDRTAEAEALLEAGRSLTEPAVQRLYHDYALELARLAQPDVLGLAAEVNLFRAVGPPASYEALARMVEATARDLKLLDAQLPLYVSVQVDTAWGRDGSRRPFTGVLETRTDFPSMDLMGLSTYPLLGWDTPESIPDDYFTRLLGEAALPGLVSESGWPSQFPFKPTSPDLQARWIRKLARLSDAATVSFVGQLLFSDFDAFIPVPPGSVLEFFAFQGLVDRNFNSKPALSAWDEVFRRPHSGGQ